MTVEINTPEGMKSGSSVIEVKVNRFPSWVTLGHTDHEYRLRGEAVTVDLGERGMLFAILRGHPWDADYAKRIVLETFGRIPAPHDIAELPPLNMPRMVTFADMNDPTTIEVAYHVELDDEASSPVEGQHYSTTDNMSALFGEDVRIARVTIEVTDDAVTTGIDKILPYGKNPDFPAWFAQLPYGDPRRITRSDFVREYSK